MLKIITHPNPILKRRSQVVTDFFAAEIRLLIAAMMETMLEKDGVGLAAPQIGQNIRLIVVKGENGNLIAFNPRIVKKSFFQEWGEEGCLSVPGKYGLVKRHKKITLAFVNEKGEKQRLKAVGLMARVCQHEIDHLDGILFIEKAKKIQDTEIS